MKLISIIITVFLIACGSNNTESSKSSDSNNSSNDTSLVYQSGANGVANIQLSLLKNKTFKFYMRIIPQPMTDEKESVVNSTGTWSNNDKWMRLTFKNDKLILTSLFDSSYADKNQFKIIDKSIVDINGELNELSIWGVNCNKIEK